LTVFLIEPDHSPAQAGFLGARIRHGASGWKVISLHMTIYGFPFLMRTTLRKTVYASREIFA
jgi:hypothetical protein